MSWHFNEKSRGEWNIDPTEHAFFDSETIGGIAGALVREAIQNSLDAASGQTIRVRFYRGAAHASARDRYLNDLWPHVEAAFEAHRDEAARKAPTDMPRSLPSRQAEFEFLVVEDEGTRGLEGDPEQDDDETRDGRNDFYYFWRNVGRSRKEANERGRWGVGKAVFTKASRLHAFFGLTQRRSDGRQLLMGLATLKMHKLDGRSYRPYGYYGVHNNDFTTPIDAAGAIQQFIQCFGLRRNGPGLSIVIPYPDTELTTNALLEAVLHHYFYPLVTGKLEVEIQDSRNGSIVLRDAGLEQEVRRRPDLRPLLPLIELARWGTNPEPEAMAKLHVPNPTQYRKEIPQNLFPSGTLNQLRQRYDSGRRLAVDVELSIEEYGNVRRPASFRLLIERDEQDSRGDGHFVRQGITIENPKVRRPRGVRWILVVDDPILSEFLGDAENPAHTEWERRTEKFKAKYRNGPSTLDFVKAAPANIISVLSQTTETRDPDLLRHIFSLSNNAATPSFQRAQPTQTGREERTAVELVPGTLGKDGTLALEKVRTGFRLRGRADGHAPRRLEILAAYDVLRGDPFKAHSPLDFRMDKTIAIHAKGARVLQRLENRVVIEIDSPDFELLATHFDENRDLRVKIRPVEDEQ